MAIIITEYRNVVSWNDDDTRFEMEINHPEYGWIPFTFDMSDDGTLIDKDALRTLVGTNFRKATQEEKDSQQTVLMRADRNDKLAYEVDEVMTNSVRWAELTTEQQNAWKQYRTDLLNVPQQEGFPYTITWPTKPE